MIVRRKFVHGEDCIFPPGGDEKFVLEDSESVQVFHRCSAYHGLAIISIVVTALNVV